MLVAFDFNTWKEYIHIEKNDRKTFNKINILILEIKKDYKGGLGKPEPLKHELQGYYSRRIDKKNRLIYKCITKTFLLIK